MHFASESATGGQDETIARGRNARRRNGLIEEHPGSSGTSVETLRSDARRLAVGTGATGRAAAGDNEGGGSSGEDRQYWHEQDQSDAGAVVAQGFILAGAAGLDFGEAALRREAITSGWCVPGGGTPASCVARLLHAHGVATDQGYGGTLDDIVARLDRGDRVLVAQASDDLGDSWGDRSSTVPMGEVLGIPGQGAGRIVQVIDVIRTDKDARVVVLNDPSRPDGQGLIVTEAAFDAGWAANDRFTVATAADGDDRGLGGRPYVDAVPSMADRWTAEFRQADCADDAAQRWRDGAGPQSRSNVVATRQRALLGMEEIVVERNAGIEDVMKQIRKTPLFQQVIPMEAGVGWPIPLRKEGRVYVTLPFFGLSPRPAENTTVLHPPFATITLDWTTKVAVEYVNLRFRNPWLEGDWEAEAGTFPHPEVARLTIGEYTELRAELLAMYDDLFGMLARRDVIPGPWTERFGELLRTLLEPSLAPHYRALGPRFFERFLMTGA